MSTCKRCGSRGYILVGDSDGTETCECQYESKPAEQPPEVPAPDEVFVIIDELGVPLPRAPYSVVELARDDMSRMTRHVTVRPKWDVVRYVRAKEGGR